MTAYRIPENPPRPTAVDLLPGSELVRLSLEIFGIDVEFDRAVIQIGAPFNLTSKGGTATWIYPDERRGDVLSLWALVGAKVVGVTWDGTITLRFDREVALIIPASPGEMRGTILRKDMISFEEF